MYDISLLPLHERHFLHMYLLYHIQKKDNFIQILQDKKWALNEVNNVSLNLTVLALQGIQLLLNTGQLALQGLHDCSVVILHLPHLFSISLALGLNLRQLVGLSLGQVRPQGDIF